MLNQNDNRRLATWWITYEDLNWPDSDNYENMKRRVEAFNKAGVTTLVLFGAHFRFDWIPYFTLLHDYIRTLAEECHKYNMELFDHYSVNLVHRHNTMEEMRHIMMHSGPHLPISPTFEAAKTWKYNGHYLNEFRMIDTRNRQPLYFKQYQGEGFCHRNPDFVDAAIAYAKQLVKDTGIDGISADDTVYYMHYRGCACEHCLAEFKRRSGIDLPDCDDTSFWGNFDNPAWHDWLDMRFEAAGDFHEKFRAAMPENFVLFSCGSISANPITIGTASDARQFLRGCTMANIELVGNTPPYKHDNFTLNHPIPSRVSSASHHQAAAREHGKRCIGTTYAFTEVTAQIGWALNKFAGADAWMGTLKARLGLPRHILKTLPMEEEIVKEPFLFEKEHEYLFKGDFYSQIGVYYAQETRNHTLFGALRSGYFKDYSEILLSLSCEGIGSHTLFNFPKTAEKYPVIALVSAYRLTEKEKQDIAGYIKAGGKVIACGPCALNGCNSSFKMPNALNLKSEDFHFPVNENSTMGIAPWFVSEVPEYSDKNEYTEIKSGLFYNPCRYSEEETKEKTLDLIRKFMKSSPVELIRQEGYLSTLTESKENYVLQLLAADYDTDVDHELDDMRYHRSRVNFINKVEPIGIKRDVYLKSDVLPDVYTPFNKEEATVKSEISNGKKVLHITLPEKCSYAVMEFKK